MGHAGIEKDMDSPGKYLTLSEALALALQIQADTEKALAKERTDQDQEQTQLDRIEEKLDRLLGYVPSQICPRCDHEHSVQSLYGQGPCFKCDCPYR